MALNQGLCPSREYRGLDRRYDIAFARNLFNEV
jgi:hypothetical protein